MAGRPPDYDILVKRNSREDKDYTKAGVIWVNDGGKSLSIKLGPCVVLSGNDDIVITAFHNDDERPKKQQSAEPPQNPPY